MIPLLVLQTDMPLAKTRYTSVLLAKKFLIFKIHCLPISEKIPTVVVIHLPSIIVLSRYIFGGCCVYNLIQDFNVSVGFVFVFC